MRQARNLRRSRSNAMIAGVCGGIAEHFGWSVTGTRVAYVLISILSVAFPGHGLVPSGEIVATFYDRDPLTATEPTHVIAY